MIRKMSLKQNLVSIITAHPKLVTISFAIAAVAVGLAAGFFAWICSGHNK